MGAEIAISAFISMITMIMSFMTNKTNTEKQQEILNYQKERDTIQDERADSVYQRSVQDMSLAGLNPAMLNAQAQGGQLADTTEKHAPEWKTKFDSLNQMAEMVYNYKEKEARISQMDAETQRAQAESANITADTTEKQLQIDYLNTIANDRVRKYREEINNLTQDTEGKALHNQIQKDLKEGYKTLQDLQIEANQIGNKILTNEKNISDQDWKFLERYGISREMSPEERRAAWKKMEQIIYYENGIQTLEIRHTLNNAEISKQLQEEIQFRDTSNYLQNWIGTAGNVAGNIMGGSGGLMRGLSFLLGKGRNINNMNFPGLGTFQMGGYNPTFSTGGGKINYSQNYNKP